MAPDDLAVQVPVIIDVLNALGLAIVGHDGYEADDVIGTLAATASMPVDVVTGDRDLFQVVDDAREVRVLYIARGVGKHERVDDAWVRAKYDIPAAHYVDFAVLRGDASDGLPGVAGIGEKTAASLINSYGGLDEILAAASSADTTISGGVRSKLGKAIDYLAVAPTVVAVATDIDLGVTADDLRLPDRTGRSGGFRGPDRAVRAGWQRRAGRGESCRTGLILADWAELDRIRTARGRPYAVELSADPGVAEPAAVITAYGRGSDPIVLWGSWLGSEVIIGVDPLVERGGLDAADCWGPLKTWPQLPEPVSDAIGGGWFAVLGYDPGTSWLAFCDAVLRRRADGSWVFESLGLAGREDAMAAALARAQTALSECCRCGRCVPGAGEAGAPAIGPLSPVAGLPAAADDHLAGVERVIGRIRAGEVYQLNLCTRLTGELLVDPLELFVRTAAATRPAYGAHLPTGALPTGTKTTWSVSARSGSSPSATAG